METLGFAIDLGIEPKVDLKAVRKGCAIEESIFHYVPHFYYGGRPFKNF